MEYIIDGIKYTVSRSFVDDGTTIVDKLIELILESDVEIKEEEEK